MKDQFDEYCLLDWMYLKMRMIGQSQNTFMVKFDEKNLPDIHTIYPNITYEKLIEILNICRANHWIEQKEISTGNPYSLVGITTAGLGIAKSRHIENQRTNTIPKKIICWCNSNPGVLAVAAILVSAVSLITSAYIAINYSSK